MVRMAMETGMAWVNGWVSRRMMAECEADWLKTAGRFNKSIKDSSMSPLAHGVVEHGFGDLFDGFVDGLKFTVYRVVEHVVGGASGHA